MIKKKHVLFTAVLTLLFATASPAKATIMTLTFEGLQDQEQILNYYNGGLGGKGSGPGPNFGVTFNGNALALIESDKGGSGNFRNPPSGKTVMFSLDPSLTMNVAAGFNTGFSFFYALQVGHTAMVDVYSGLNGTGTKLGHITLVPTPDPYNVWVPEGVGFAGTAESVVFSGDANFVGWDNVTFGSETPGVPEPASLALAGVGVAGLVGYRMRRRRKVAC